MERNSPKYIALQMLVWGGGWLAIFLILSNGAELDARFWLRTWVVVAGASLVVLVNLKWLLPSLYFKKKRLAYLGASLLLVMGTVWVMHTDAAPWNQLVERRPEYEQRRSERHIHSDEHQEKIERNRKASSSFRWFMKNLPVLISLLGSSMVALSRFAAAKEKEAIRLDKSRLETEVKFLKSQINPHFLFNSLHNIYALTVMQSEKAPEQLLKLSDILRYMLYDSNEDRVPLRREIEYLKNYISLVQLKDSRGMDLAMDFDESQPELLVAPLLFIPFVENAVKHSQVEDLKKGYIKIELKTFEGGLHFFVENSVPEHSYTKDQVGGIGLNNIQQRLQLLYPDCHSLEVDSQASVFKIHLELHCL